MVGHYLKTKQARKFYRWFEQAWSDRDRYAPGPITEHVDMLATKKLKKESQINFSIAIFLELVHIARERNLTKEWIPSVYFDLGSTDTMELWCGERSLVQRAAYYFPPEIGLTKRRIQGNHLGDRYIEEYQRCLRFAELGLCADYERILSNFQDLYCVYSCYRYLRGHELECDAAMRINYVPMDEIKFK